jgi:hypothetical protein
MIAVAISVAIFALIGFWLLSDDKKENGGLFFWERRELLARGAQASGRVLDQATHSPGWINRMRAHTVDIVVEFTPEGGTPVRVLLRYRLPDGAWADMTEKGRTVNLRYDPRKPTRALIAWGLDGDPPDRTSKERAADKARQEALLRGEK